MIRIIPKPGAPIRHPVTRELLPAAGILVDRLDAHWLRRKREGGVEVVTEPAPETTPSETTEPSVDLGAPKE